MGKNKRVLIVIHNGVEDVEFITPYDMMIRSGLDPEVLFLNEEDHLRTSYGLKIKNPHNRNLVNYLSDYDALFIPGGPGTTNVDNDPDIDKILSHFVTQNKVIGAICAAPTILAKRGYLKDKKAICFNDKNLRSIMVTNGAIIEDPACDWGQPCEVVIDGRFVTGLGMRSALPFAIRFINEVKKH